MTFVLQGEEQLTAAWSSTCLARVAVVLVLAVVAVVAVVLTPLLFALP